MPSDAGRCIAYVSSPRELLWTRTNTGSGARSHVSLGVMASISAEVSGAVVASPAAPGLDAAWWWGHEMVRQDKRLAQ